MKYFYRISPWLLQTFIWPGTRLILNFFSRFTVAGLENLGDLPRGVVFAVNHSSELDPILIPAALPFMHHLMPMFYTSREKSFYINSSWRKMFYGGFLFKVWGAHPVLTGVHDYEASLKTHIDILKNGGSVMIFPEGRKTRDGALQPGKGGVAYLSYVSNAPIVPVLIDGVFQTKPVDFFLRRRTIRVTFGMPIAKNALFPSDKKIELDGVHDSFIEAAGVVMKKIGALRAPSGASVPLTSPIQSDELAAGKINAKF